MKFSDVKELSAIELNKKIRETKEKMFDSKMKNSMVAVEPVCAKFAKRGSAPRL